MTENEGDLKKRISEIYNSHPDVWNGPTKEQQFDALVDEAKKEFDNLIIVRENKNPILDYDEVLDWYIKWFGESE
jgi:hypothetical protein